MAKREYFYIGFSTYSQNLTAYSQNLPFCPHLKKWCLVSHLLCIVFQSNLCAEVMKTKLLLFLPFLLVWAGKISLAQTTLINNNGAKINIANNTDLRVNNLQNTGTNSQIVNNGDLYVSGTFSQTSGATYSGGTTSWLWFDGTSLQTISSDVALSIARLKIDNNAGAQLSQNVTISTDLQLVQGDLDLNGKIIDLGATGTLTEDRNNNHIVKDNTATNDYNPGGGITFSSNVTNTSSEIRGTGLYLQRTTGSDYTVNITRRHYKGGLASGGGHGIARIYQITGSPTGTDTKMRIYYASDETAGVGASSTYVLFRWQSATGWKKADAGASGFFDGTNGTDYVEGTGINEFSHWTVGSSTAPLPITLLGLKGKRVEGLRGEMTEEVKLEWQTAQEINNKGFEIEMSENGLAYQKIAFVEGKGTSNMMNNYQLTTTNPNDGYYRLKQIDFDGKFSYSPVVFVEGLQDIFKIFPNPTAGEVQIMAGELNTQDQLQYTLFDAQGKAVWTIRENLEKGNLALNQFLPHAPNGTYILRIINGKKLHQHKLIIQH
jgi:hypothetical protein